MSEGKTENWSLKYEDWISYAQWFSFSLMCSYTQFRTKQNIALRWLGTVFQGQYLPSLSINYVAIKKVLEKLQPQLY